MIQPETSISILVLNFPAGVLGAAGSFLYFRQLENGFAALTRASCAVRICELEYEKLLQM